MIQEEIIEMTRQVQKDCDVSEDGYRIWSYEALGRLIKLATAKEREACAHKVEEFARKWWKIHCDSNLHYSSTLRAHQDFCALQAAIRARDKHDKSTTSI